MAEVPLWIALIQNVLLTEPAVCLAASALQAFLILLLVCGICVPDSARYNCSEGFYRRSIRSIYFIVLKASIASIYPSFHQMPVLCVF